MDIFSGSEYLESWKNRRLSEPANIQFGGSGGIYPFYWSSLIRAAGIRQWNKEWHELLRSLQSQSSCLIIEELREKVKFIQITNSGFAESNVHGISKLNWSILWIDLGRW